MVVKSGQWITDYRRSCYVHKRIFGEELQEHIKTNK
jgi:hypothetical protein